MVLRRLFVLDFSLFSTHMMGQVCIHYEEEVPSSMLHAVDVRSAFEWKPELVSKGY